MKMYKRDVFKEETVKVLNELMIDNLLVQQVIEKLLKVANISDTDVEVMMKTLDSRTKSTNDIIEELKTLCNEEVL